MVFDTHHAIALHTANDTELILHVGLDTVKLNGQHLEVFVQEGKSDHDTETELYALEHQLGKGVLYRAAFLRTISE